jgi:alcohol dehydrogenase (NADP+)
MTTQGGYSNKIVVDENYVLSVPQGLPLDKTAPLLCAGITLYSPLIHWKAGPGKKVAIIGLGGLGHMGVKIAHALGAEVAVYFDLIINTVSVNLDLNKYLNMLKLDGSMVLVGIPESQMQFAPPVLLGARRSLSGSGIGGIKETQ